MGDAQAHEGPIGVRRVDNGTVAKTATGRTHHAHRPGKSVLLQAVPAPTRNPRVALLDEWEGQRLGQCRG